ncbi:hypothetical protein C8R46DRAFT_1094918 [Mycena filopes]|nr:hypothetical protein C8R46DRAFT_1094918 [Mycena filopes]
MPRRRWPWGRKQPPAPTALQVSSASSPKPSALPDVLSTSLLALKESADAFPPLKSAVGGVLAVWDIAKRAKRCKSDAADIAKRTEDILCLIADAVPDPSAIPSPMLKSIEGFTFILNDICTTMEKILLARSISRVVHLNSTERTLREIKSKLDDAYRDFLAASALRMEVQQAEIAVEHKALAVQTHTAVDQVTNILKRDISSVLFYSRLSVFLAHP